MLRLFIAIELPGFVKQWIQAVQKQLRSSGVEASWPKPATLHLTLKFLGETDSAQLDQVKESMILAARSSRQISLYSAGIGVFPAIKRARVLWAGVRGGIEDLNVLANDLEDALHQSIGVIKEKKIFTPHLTLARIKQPLSPQKVSGLIQRFQTSRTDPFSAKQIVLMKSERHSTGAVHRPLFSVKLNGRDLKN